MKKRQILALGMAAMMAVGTCAIQGTTVFAGEEENVSGKVRGGI